MRSREFTSRAPRAFTLTELLVVMGVIALLSVLTVVSVKAVTRDARLSSATNDVTATLNNARALALKTNRPVLVAFYPRREGEDTRVEAITAAWTGDSFVEFVTYPLTTPSQDRLTVFDRFRPLPDVPVRRLAPGIKVAGPAYLHGADETLRDDQTWLVMTELTEPDEAPGEIVGVLYGPDGTTLLDNPANDSDFFWIDFNDSGFMEMDRNGDGEVTPAVPGTPGPDLVFASPPVALFDFLELTHPQDEVAIQIVPFLAVFDDDAARETYDTTAWVDVAARQADLTQFIRERADRIHFNRYTGVAMR